MPGRGNLGDLLERIAVGIEKLNEPPPPVEIEVGLPICPVCHEINPRVTTAEQGGTGRMAEIYLEMKCDCGARIYGAPVQWSMHDNTDTLRAELVERIEHVGNGRIARDGL